MDIKPEAGAERPGFQFTHKELADGVFVSRSPEFPVRCGGPTFVNQEWQSFACRDDWVDLSIVEVPGLRRGEMTDDELRMDAASRRLKQEFGSCGQVYGGPFVECVLQSFAWHMLRRHEAHTFQGTYSLGEERVEGGRSLWTWTVHDCYRPAKAEWVQRLGFFERALSFQDLIHGGSQGEGHMYCRHQVFIGLSSGRMGAVEVALRAPQPPSFTTGFLRPGEIYVSLLREGDWGSWPVLTLVSAGDRREEIDRLARSFELRCASDEPLYEVETLADFIQAVKEVLDV